MHLPAAVCSPEGGISKRIRLLDNEELELSLVESDITENLPDHLLLFPWVEIVLKKRAFRRSEFTVDKDGSLLIQKGEPAECNWYKSAQEIVQVYNSLIGQLFRMYPDKPWERIRLTYFASFSLPGKIGMLQSNFPDCLFFWHVHVREQTSDEWVWCIPKADLCHPDLPSLPEVDLGQIHVITSTLEAGYRAKGAWSIGWEYLFQASCHLESHDFRNAVIGLDIAADFVVRESIKRKAAISAKYMDKILDKSSTGDLLNIAQALATEEPEAITWQALRELHSLRGTVLHRYQRHFGDRQIDTIRSAQKSLVSVLRDLDMTS